MKSSKICWDNANSGVFIFTFQPISKSSYSTNFVHFIHHQFVHFINPEKPVRGLMNIFVIFIHPYMNPLPKWNKNLQIVQATTINTEYWFITLFENFLFWLKSFNRKNIVNSCIENICISICFKWITAKKKSSHQNWFREI